MLTIDALKNYGANTDEGLTRCMNNEMLYLRLAGKVLEDGNFDKLSSSIEAGNLDDAFEAAHALKGVLGNLSLTPLYEKASEITELLRSRTQTDYSPLVSAIMNDRNTLIELNK